MESVKLDSERGQILVQVALMVVVLFAFVALALDVGHVYAGRRRMQNAADAGALAGAREICFGDYETADDREAGAEEAAVTYAESNGAEDPEVTIDDDGLSVIVTATQTLDTFFAGVIGINTADVRAEAAAMCGGARSASYLWPIAFEYNRYKDDVGCGEDFWVFVNDPEGDDDPICPPDGCECVGVGDEPMDKKDPCYDFCDCAELGSSHVAPDYRGWVEFVEPPEYIDSPCPAGQGTTSLRCWIRNPYPGEIAAGECALSEPGGSIGVKDAVNDMIGEIAGIILWGEGCEDEQHKSYYVEDFGCMELLQYWGPEDKVPACGDPSKNCKHPHLIQARKVCQYKVDADGNYELDDDDQRIKDPDYERCASVTGSTGGEFPDDMELRTVSLIQWPRP